MATSDKPTILRLCPLHEGEPIIRACLDPEEKQVFYCHECVFECDSRLRSKLVKLTEVSKSLYDQMTKKATHGANSNLEADLKDFNIDRDQALAHFDELITNQKQKIDDNFQKIEKHMIETIRLNVPKIHKRFDDRASQLKVRVDAYIKNLELFSNSKALENSVFVKEEIDRELANGEDTKELEKLIRVRLDTIKMLNQLNKGTATKNLLEEKLLLESLWKDFNIVPTADEEHYNRRILMVSPFIGMMAFAGADISEKKELFSRIKLPVTLWK